MEDIYKDRILMLKYCNEINSNAYYISTTPKIVIPIKEGCDNDYIHYLGKLVSYKIEKSGYKNEVLLASIVQEIEVPESTPVMRTPKTYAGKVINVQSWGGYISINNERTITIYNKDLFGDQSRMDQVFKVGDIIKNIRVRTNFSDNCSEAYLEEKICTLDKIESLSCIKIGNEYPGIVNLITPTSCFVSIFNGVDVLCQIPEFLPNDIETGDNVVVRISSFKMINDEKKFRGKVVYFVD